MNYRLRLENPDERDRLVPEDPIGLPELGLPLRLSCHQREEIQRPRVAQWYLLPGLLDTPNELLL
jgi:hypothetical protein